MSAVLAAVFENHQHAEQVRTRLVKDGFPTDRVELTSSRELGQASVVPAGNVEAKLTEYFARMFPEGAEVPRLREAVQAGHAVICVQPRGQVETDRAVQILNDAGPMEMKAADLESQTLEYAAAREEGSTLSWIGRVMVAPQVRDR